MAPASYGRVCAVQAAWAEPGRALPAAARADSSAPATSAWYLAFMTGFQFSIANVARQAATRSAGRPRDQHRVRLVPLTARVILLLAGDVRHQRLHACQRHPEFPAQPLDLHPPRPGRLARHRQPRHPRRGRRRDRVRDRPAQLVRRTPRVPPPQHPHVMIHQRQCLLRIPQVDAQHRPVTRQQPPQMLPVRVPPPVRTRNPATLAHQDVLSGCVWDTKPALPHQEDVSFTTGTRRSAASRGHVLLLRGPRPFAERAVAPQGLGSGSSRGTTAGAKWGPWSDA